MLRRALSAHERLERIVLSERGLDGVAGALAVADRRPGAGLRRARRGARARAPARAARRDGARRAGAELRERARAGARRGYAPGGELHGRALALPVARTPRAATATARRRRRGSSRPRTPGALTEFDRLTLHQAVTIVALELLRRRVADDTERRLAGDVLSRAGRPASSRAPSWRAGWSRSGCASASACSCSPRRGRSAAAVEDGARRARCATRCRRRAGRPAPAASRARCCRSAAATATTSCSRSPSACARACRARRGPRARRRRGPRRRAGRPAARASTRRAARSRRARSPADGDGDGRRRRLATYRDLGSFQLLLSLQDDDALRLFCDSILAPIEDGEGAYGGELMRSLEAFIECNGQWERAATPALLPPSHAALPDPPRRGADRPLAGLRARPDRLLARPARARAGRP